jgi:uncharacterized FAD-dependent dehydrogenase
MKIPITVLAKEAGTYSDGKLYTRSKERCNFRVASSLGATRHILIEAHPHIGTNKLPQIIQDIREKIIECGVSCLKQELLIFY